MKSSHGANFAFACSARRLSSSVALKAILGEVVRLPTDVEDACLRYGVSPLVGRSTSVWRTQTTDVWAVFRFPGLQLLSLVFSATQFPLMMKGARLMEAEPEPAEPEAGGP